MDVGGRDCPPPREGRDGRDNNRGGCGFQPRPFTPGGHNGGSRPRLQTILTGASSAPTEMGASGTQTSSVTLVIGPATLLPNVTCSPLPSSSRNTRRRPLPT
jgi:hypothetical protein